MSHFSRLTIGEKKKKQKKRKKEWLFFKYKKKRQTNTNRKERKNSHVKNVSSTLRFLKFKTHQSTITDVFLTSQYESSE
jgi:hypothetical protein